MTATVVESRTVDPIARWAAILYCAGVVIWPSLTVLYLIDRQWLMVAAGLVLTAVFVLLAGGWIQASRCRIRLDEGTVSRAGQLGWRYAYTEIADYDLTEIRGRTYLVIVPRRPPARTSMSRTLLGKSLPRGAVAGPVRPELKEQIRTVLDERIPTGAGSG